MWLYCCDTECQICHEHQISREIPAQPRPGSPTHTIPPTVDIQSLHLEFKFRDVKLATLLYLGYHPLVCRKHRKPSRPEDWATPDFQRQVTKLECELIHWKIGSEKKQLFLTRYFVTKLKEAIWFDIDPAVIRSQFAKMLNILPNGNLQKYCFHLKKLLQC